MVTPVRIEANRRNALKSTGPRTAAGKLTSSKNAAKHGILSTDVVLPNEDAEEFAKFCADLRDQLSPVGHLEQILVDKIAVSAWRLGRIHRVEASVFVYHMSSLRGDQARTEANTCRSTLEELMIKPTVIDELRHEQSLSKAAEADSARDNELLGGAFIRGTEGSDSFSKLSRYETAIERGLFRAMHELQRLQTARAGQPVPVPVVIDVEVTSQH